MKPVQQQKIGRVIHQQMDPTGDLLYMYPVVEVKQEDEGRDRVNYLAIRMFNSSSAS